MIHAFRGSEGDIAVKVIRKGRPLTLSLAVLARPRMIDWVGLHFSGLVVGKELMRDAKLSNPNDEMLVLDVASASVGSVVGLDAYSYLHTIYDLSVSDIRQLCSHLSQAENQSLKVKIVTRSATWGYMTASEYSLYDLKVKDVKLVGPHVLAGKPCEGQRVFIARVPLSPV